MQRFFVLPDLLYTLLCLAIKKTYLHARVVTTIKVDPRRE
jgi:hypothetical protein